MKKSLLVLGSLCFSLFAEEAQIPEKKPLDIGVVSEAFGHLIGKNLESLGFDFEMKRVLKGLEDSFAGKHSPMSETECVQAISEMQEAAFQKLSVKNLEEANEFMVVNAQSKDVVEVEKGKLQYKVDQAGAGEAVQEHDSPLIRYTGRFLDGQVFGQSKEDELITLDDTIKGFSKGIVGMKEGEKRTLYIHPELGYGTAGYLPPNSLLTFEIELVKANAPKQEDVLSTKGTDAKAALDADVEVAETR